MAGIGVDRAGNRADSAAATDLLRLENLDTDVPPHPSVIAATAAAIIEDRKNSYLPFTGQQRLRQAVADHVSRLAGVPYDPDRNVLISAGGLSGILNVLLAVIEPGDEVILTDPIYIGLLNRVHLAGGVPKLVPLIPSGREWALDRGALQQAVSEKTRALLLMSPSMPSGAYLTSADRATVAAVRPAQHNADLRIFLAEVAAEGWWFHLVLANINVCPDFLNGLNRPSTAAPIGSSRS